MISRNLSSLRAVAAIGVRMKPLHQILVARFDGFRIRAVVKTKLIEGLAGRRRHGAVSAPRPSARAGSLDAAMPMKSAACADRRRPRESLSRRGSTPMDQVGRWPTRASFWYKATSSGAHAVEIIVGRVVFAHMVEAEAKILSLTQAAPLARDVRRARSSPENRSAAAPGERPVWVRA